MKTSTRNHRLGPAEAWFEKCGWKPFAFQKQAWKAHLDGKSQLIHSATGTGKTLAAWMGPLLDGLAHPIEENHLLHR
jgi:ATP-dependent Lhr-like helicase